MAIVKWVLIGALATLPAAAQQQEKRVISVKHADVKALANTLGIFGCGMVPNAELKVLAVSCPADVLTALEEAVKRLDVPAPVVKNVELTAYFLVAGEGETPGSSPVPSELDPVVKQMRAAFAFKTFRLLDTLLLRTRPGQEASVSGVVGAGTSSLRIKSATPAPSDGGAVVRVDGLRAAIGLPFPTGAPGKSIYRDAGVSADIDIREGQKVVVGKSSLEGPDKALIVVLTAKVL